MKSFAKVIKWSLLTNKRYYIKQIVSLCVIFFVIMAASTGIFSGYSSAVTARDAEHAVPTIMFVWVLVSYLTATHVVFDLKTKQQRTLYMMLPASNRTKFWGRVALSAAFAFVVTPLTICVADGLQMLVSQIFSGSNASVVARMPWFGGLVPGVGDSCSLIFGNVGTLAGGFDTWLLGLVAYVSVVAWVFSSYLLGGLLLRRLPFILTTLAWIVFWAVVVVGIFKMVSCYDNCYVEFYWDKTLTLESITALIGIAFTTLNLWLASIVHKRMSVVSHNFFNI